MDHTTVTVFVGSPADADPALPDPVGHDGPGETTLEVLGRVHTGHELVARVLSEMPDVAIVDVRLDDVDAHAVCRRLHEWAPAVRVVAAGPLDDERTFGAVLNGASSAVLVEEPPELVGEVAVGAARGESRILPRMAFRLLHDLDSWARRTADPLYPPPQLTATEREVLGRLGEGTSPEDIAALHHVTAHLVNVHTGYAVAKLHRYVLGADRAVTGG